MPSENDELKRMRLIASQNGGKLISQVWSGRECKYEFEFSDGRRFERTAAELFRKKRGGWPQNPDRYFAFKKIYGKTDEEKLDALRDFVKSKEGKLLSNKWIGSHGKYLFERSDGTRFERAANDVKKNWDRPSYSLVRSVPSRVRNVPSSNGMKGWSPEEKLQKLRDCVENEGCRMLTDEWIGIRGKYQFEREDGYRFVATAERILLRGLPHFLGGHAVTSADKAFIRLTEAAASIGLRLIDEKWRGASEKYQFSGAEKSFSALPSEIYKMIRSGVGEAYVADYVAEGKYRSTKTAFKKIADKQRLEALAEMARTRGGKLITSEWLGYEAKHEFEDSQGLRFFNTPANIRHGNWSPDRGLISEPICRQIMEHLFASQFFKSSKVLSRDVLNRYGMTHFDKSWELDGFCMDRMVAFEYQGHPSHWDNAHRSYGEVNARDKNKVNVCERLGIVLVQIPPFKKADRLNSNRCFQHVLNAVEKAYDRLGRSVTSLNKSGFEIDFSIIHHGGEMIASIKEIAEENKGKLISKVWKGVYEKYEFEFSDGRRFWTTATKIRQGYWPKNADLYFSRKATRRKSSSDQIGEMRKLVEKAGCRLLSDEWVGVRGLYELELPNGMLVKESGQNIKYGYFKNGKLSKRIQNMLDSGSLCNGMSLAKKKGLC